MLRVDVRRDKVEFIKRFMTFCKSCILPDTRPGIEILENGVCNACKYARRKRGEIDWAEREQEFKELVEEAKKKKARYDCLIPVSGGKDSHWQTIKCLEYGLHPLAATWKPPIRTKLGTDNLENLIKLGVDHVDFTINPDVDRRFTLMSMKRDGTPGVPMHMAIYNICLTMAEALDIPLVVWGENSADEYGSINDKHAGKLASEKWLETFNTRGTSANDWLEMGLTRDELAPYFGPKKSKNDVVSFFLGYYFSWDPETSLKAAKERGFKESDDGALMGYYNYADLDDNLLAVHHWLKWYKFGITRSFDNLSLEVRAGRMTREEAIASLKSFGDETPRQAIEEFCEYVQISVKEFYEIAEKFRNHDIWQKVNGQWQMPSFLVDDWVWDENKVEKSTAKV